MLLLLLKILLILELFIILLLNPLVFKILFLLLSVAKLAGGGESPLERTELTRLWNVNGNKLMSVSKM